ncbi:hypothetical protein V5799_006292 [Amblyomma americanum]|uniref:Uncharacterized protein n=1 Tax=Amblyomma americanum TaxID=6943 RepID=A0AAQ4DWT3_AMBAM
MVLAMFQQYTDHEEFGSSSHLQDASTSSLSRIAAWKALYEQHRSALQSIKERTLDVQASSVAEEAQLSCADLDEEARPGFVVPGADHDTRGSSEPRVDNSVQPHQASGKLAEKPGGKDTGDLPVQLNDSLEKTPTLAGPASGVPVKPGASDLLEGSGMRRTEAGESGESSESSETWTAPETLKSDVFSPAVPDNRMEEIIEHRDGKPGGNPPGGLPEYPCSSESVRGQAIKKFSSSKFMTAENTAGDELMPPVEEHPVEGMECLAENCYAWHSWC